jgi:DNA ligase 4
MHGTTRLAGSGMPQKPGRQCHDTPLYYRKAEFTLVIKVAYYFHGRAISFSHKFTVNMPFPFRLLCDLLNELDQNRANKSMKAIQRLNTRTVVAWFSKHDRIIPRKGPEAVAFLSCLFPERRPDRVFNLQEKRLEMIIQQAQCLGATRLKDLQNWRTIDGSDLASCVERVMAATDSEPRLGPSVALEELDEILDRIAATSSFSSVDLRERVKAKYMEPIRTNDALSIIFRRLNSSEAKWMVCMVLKTYSLVHVPETRKTRYYEVK